MNIPNFNELMEKARAVQEKMSEAKEATRSITVTGKAPVTAKPLVEVTMDGAYHLTTVNIDDSLWQEQDKEMIQDLIASAVNNAADNLKQASKDKMADVAKELDLPPGFDNFIK
ncbi:MAG: YbaB/EbfC family nucleoid-associated protein [Pseudomonadota bacterium]